MSKIRQNLLGIGAVFSVVFTGFATNEANATFRICNKTPNDVGVAIGYFDETIRDWMSRGWYSVASASCNTVDLPDRRTPGQTAYFFASNRTGTWAGGAGAVGFCVSPTSAFSVIGSATNCAAIGDETRQFFEQTLDNSGNVSFELAPYSSTPPADDKSHAPYDFEKQTKALNLITQTADSICSSVEHSGAEAKDELSNDVKSKLNTTAGKLSELGIENASKYDKSSYKNVVQTDLLSAIKNNTECKLEVFKVLQEKLLK